MAQVIWLLSNEIIVFVRESITVTWFSAIRYTVLCVRRLYFPGGTG